MAGMGRKRKDGNPLGLERRVEAHHGQFRYLHRDGRKESLGTDIVKANERARIYNDPDGRIGTLGYFIDLRIAEARAGRLHKKLRPRTIDDNEEQAEILKVYFDKTHPADLVADPSPITEYRNIRSAPYLDAKGKQRKGAPVRANRELSLLSATYDWMIEEGKVRGLIVNPVKLIARNPESPKERYVEDAEYRPVYAIGQRSVCMAMEIVYRTLQRPSDVLALPPSAVRTQTVAGGSKRVLTVVQGKTGRTVHIELTADLEASLLMLSPDGVLGSRAITEDGKVRKHVPALIHTQEFQPYTEEGLGAMLRRYCHRAKVSTFGLMDVRAKGATDMYLAGESLEKIRELMGHASVKTTEIYIKRMLSTISVAAPNQRRVGA